MLDQSLMISIIILLGLVFSTLLLWIRSTQLIRISKIKDEHYQELRSLTYLHERRLREAVSELGKAEQARKEHLQREFQTKLDVHSQIGLP